MNGPPTSLSSPISQGRRSPGTTSAREKWTPPGPRSTRSVCTPSGALAATDTCCCSRLGPIQQTTRAAASTDGLQADFVSPDMQDKYNSDMQDKYEKLQLQIHILKTTRVAASTDGLQARNFNYKSQKYVINIQTHICKLQNSTSSAY